MLTQQQQAFIAKLSDNTIVAIKLFDPKAAEHAGLLIKKIGDLGLEVFWEGSLALEIPGENDIDLYIFCAPKDFDTYLPRIISIFAKPTYILTDKILWRIKKDGYKIDASLAAKDSPEVKRDMLFYSSLKKNPALLKDYSNLKTPGLSGKEYYIRKNEFYNKITGNK